MRGCEVDGPNALSMTLLEEGLSAWAADLEAWVEAEDRSCDSRVSICDCPGLWTKSTQGQMLATLETSSAQVRVAVSACPTMRA
jgi:hypothetical protein